MRRGVVQGIICSFEEALRVPAAGLEASPQSMIDQSSKGGRKRRAPRRTQPPHVPIDQRRRVGVLIIFVVSHQNFSELVVLAVVEHVRAHPRGSRSS